MPAKKVPLTPKPHPRVEAFVSGGSPRSVKMKRLTLDIPEELHRAIKLRAVQQGVAMADMLRAVLQELYGQASHE